MDTSNYSLHTTPTKAQKKVVDENVENASQDFPTELSQNLGTHGPDVSISTLFFIGCLFNCFKRVTK